MISLTPAVFAGTIFIRTEEGYAAIPPGTYAYPIESRHFLTKDRSVRFTVKPTVLSLFFMIRLNIFQSLSDYLNQSSVDLSISFFNFFFFYKNRLLIKTEAVEFFCIFKKGFIASGADIVYDCLYGVLIGAVVIWVTL